jgi:alpha-L-rhamnosidase
MKNPLGLTVSQPRLGWLVTADQRGQVQSAYQILVADSIEALDDDQGTLWDSGRVASSQTTHIPYAGTTLDAVQRCYWKVRVWDGDGEVSDYSDAAHWQMGLLDHTAWQGRWIGLNPEPEPELGMHPGVHLRHGFTVDKPVAHATLYATAKGVYRASLNGTRVGRTELAPGWTDYTRRIQVQTYDVTDQVREGDNAIGVTVADGWYSGYLGFRGIHTYYGEFPRALAQLVIEHPDGTTTVIATGEAWRAATGPIRFSDIQMGERYDARREIPGWDTPDADDSAAPWQSVIVEPLDTGVVLEGQRDQPMRVTEEIEPEAITEPEPGVFIFDLGQNIAGRVRLRVSGEAGDEVRLRYGEMLEPDGTLHTANLRSARATDYYTLKGGGEEIYEPTFTYHGFRYVELTGYPGDPTPDVIVGQVIHNDMDQTGTFACSDPMINQLWQNILWGQRGNFVSIPTDCPQRDERLGWSGDAQIFCRTASFNMDVAAFFTKWMLDYTDAQTPDGAFTDIAPQIEGMNKAAPAWGDAGIIIPWTLYQVYGDTQLIQRHYAAMQAWMHHIAEANPDYLRTKRLYSNYSDWVALEGGSSAEQIATAYWAKIAWMMAEMADAIGRETDALHYAALYHEIRQAYITAYVNLDGAVETNTQTAYVMALDNDLLPDHLRENAADRLVGALARHNDHLATGFLGTPPLCFVLTEMGHLDLAYKLLTNDTYPSWLYMIKNGATTMWERWNAYTIEQGIHDPGMNSFNHYAYGAIAEWLYRVVAGINAGRPGYKHVDLQPRPGGGLTHAKATYRSLHGTIESGWRIEGDGADGRTHYEVTVPANTTATLSIPTTNPATVHESGDPASAAAGVRFERYENGFAVFELVSGRYHFVAE